MYNSSSASFELKQIKAANLSPSLSDDRLLFSAQDMSNMLSC